MQNESECDILKLSLIFFQDGTPVKIPMEITFLSNATDPSKSLRIIVTPWLSRSFSQQSWVTAMSTLSRWCMRSLLLSVQCLPLQLSPSLSLQTFTSTLTLLTALSSVHLSIFKSSSNQMNFGLGLLLRREELRSHTASYNGQFTQSRAIKRSTDFCVF